MVYKHLSASFGYVGKIVKALDVDVKESIDSSKEGVRFVRVM